MATKLGDFDAGVASFQSEEFYNTEVMSGDTPPIVTDGPELVAQSTDLPAFSVVGRDEDGALTLATLAGAVGGEGFDSASQLMTFTTPPDVDDTVTIDGVVYTWKAAPTTVARQVKTGATNAEASANLTAAINADPAGSGTLFGSLTTAHPTVYAVNESATLMRVYAKIPGLAGNAIATTQTGDESAWSAATLAGGEGIGVVPLGITPTVLLTGVGVTTTTDIMRQGCFDPDALNWDASFVTDDQKRRAFEGSPSPTNIVLRRRKNGPVFP